MASSKDYWTKRAEENDARNLASEMEGIEKIRAAFEQAQAEIQKKIDTFYRKYEEDGSISPADAKKRLTPSELNAFRKEIAKLSKDASEEEKKRLDQLKQRLYISRQEALLAEIQHFAVKLHAATEETISQTLEGIYKQQESHNHYNLEQQLGWGVNFEGLAPAQIEALIHQGYDGRDFSEKTWYSTTQLVKNLNVLLPQQFLLGRSTQDIAKELSKTMNTPRYAAEALVRTEGSNVASQADLNFYQKANIKSYEFMATLDDRTSEECQMLDGMHFNVKDAQTGVNLPPIHTNCRSTTLPDVDMDDIDETRLAKDVDGNYISIPKQSYSDWVRRDNRGKYLERKYYQSVQKYYGSPKPSEIELVSKTYRYNEENVELTQKMLTSLGFSSFEDFESTALETFKRLYPKEEFIVRIPDAALAAFLEDGVYRASGEVDPGNRRIDEPLIFDLKKDTPIKAHPVYGMMYTKAELENTDFNPTKYGKRYGQNVIVLKKSNVEDRTTFTLGDSLNNTRNTKPSLVEDPKIYSFGTFTSKEKFQNATNLTSLSAKRFVTDQYAEIQIRGGFSLSDVEYIRLRDEPDEAFKKLLEDNNVKWEVYKPN